ncbi:periplasmic component of the Tol biopolymer transport system [Longilinea arvoryzae]|uniref:Periplasmic component of the Tol biopolymer transport system n=1 Tax=Longilinea arvoryzae TaxID=360412 RepID=A0A0K8MXJ5_9CHLR|nr:PD40 domain-containing protein [Longilinea arvoryzae]GAP15983.1 periplasmic component of the Tol biopolymer transport system [Longilinea arvoryzae]
MKRFFFIVILFSAFSLLMAGCLPLATVPVSSSTSAPVEPTVEVLPVEPDGGPGNTPATGQPGDPTQPLTESIVAFVGQDGNIALLNVASGQKTPVTSDAATYGPDNSTPVVIYQNPKWSSDGRYLAFERQVGTPSKEGFDFAYALLVYDFESGETRVAQDGLQTAGFAWKPGTHLLAFGLAVQPGYFVTRGGVDSSLATGISAVDVDTLSGSRLVAPENGFALVNPNWSPDGRILSFEEVNYMEGRGNFAFYDFTAGAFTHWDKAIGSVSWAPDGSKLLHDNLNYAPSFSERIFEINRDGSNERQLTPDAENAYAYNPLYSPDGSQIAYIAARGQDTDTTAALMVMPASGGEARELASQAQIYTLAWTPDGQNLLASTGNYPDLKVTLIALADGSQTALADGWQAVMRP